MKNLVVLTLAVAACSHAAGEPAEATPPIQVTCAPVTSTQLTPTVHLRGVVLAPPDRQALVAPTSSGRLSQLHVVEGDLVTAGQLLAVIDNPTLAAARAEADAQVASARGNQTTAAAAATRAQRLFDEGIAARKEVEDSQAHAAGASAELNAALARQSLAKAEVDRATVRAPIAGTVVHVLRRVGELVDGTPATPIVEIADPSILELRASVPAADLVHLAAGQPAEVRLDALPEIQLRGKVTAVSPAVDPATAQGSVRVALDAPPADVHLRLGLAGAAAIPLAARTALTVPATALRRGATGDDEVIVCQDGKAAVRAVHAGERAGDAMAVTGDLAAGDEVVVDHVLNLEDGAPLSTGAETGSPASAPPTGSPASAPPTGSPASAPPTANPASTPARTSPTGNPASAPATGATEPRP